MHGLQGLYFFTPADDAAAAVVSWNVMLVLVLVLVLAVLSAA
jgi:hypothetical protein